MLLTFLFHFDDKKYEKWKKAFLTREQSAQHPFAGQSTQQIIGQCKQEIWLPVFGRSHYNAARLYIARVIFFLIHLTTVMKNLALLIVFNFPNLFCFIRNLPIDIYGAFLQKAKFWRKGQVRMLRRVSFVLILTNMQTTKLV